MEGPSASEAAKVEPKAGPSKSAAEPDEEDEVPDMDEFQDDNNLVEDDAVSDVARSFTFVTARRCWVNVAGTSWESHIVRVAFPMFVNR
jgi:hypothetical protein